ncbi:MAG TPA: hypothetical protein VK195_02885, partial [Burkholderiaceae bacterium]|nr:hypothetical protein [Burkholderiaceae bacterium]
GIQSFTKPREGAVAGAEPGGFRQADAAPPAAPKNTQKDQSRVPQETSPGREKASEGEEGRRTPSSVKDTPQRTTEADKRPARKGESAGDNRKATGGADRSAAPGGVMPGSSPAARAQGLDARNSGGSNRYEPKRGTRQRDRRPTAAAVAAPAPVLPANNYFQNVTTREEALRQLLGEEWFA